MLFLPLLFISTSGLEEKQLYSAQTLGNQCSVPDPDSLNTFTVTGFTASQWPPVSLSSIDCSITGTFTDSATVSFVIYDTVDNDKKFITKNYRFDKTTFSAGQTATFEFPLMIPDLSDVSLPNKIEISIELVSDNHDKLCCWGLSFDIPQ